MSTSIQCFMFTKSQMYPKTHKYHSQMRHRSQRGLIRRYSNCTDLEWLRHFRVCFSQVLVGKVSGFLYFFLLLFLHMLTLYVPQTSWLQHSANHDCNLSAAADSCCSLQTCCPHWGLQTPSLPVPNSKLVLYSVPESWQSQSQGQQTCMLITKAHIYIYLHFLLLFQLKWPSPENYTEHCEPV